MEQASEPLTPAETRALSDAAAWYANYHAGIIAERVDEGSASAVAQREKYQDLLAGLRKLGVRLRDPQAEAERAGQRRAA